MAFDTQPQLENEELLLQALEEKDFEALYAVASDPGIWEQHPNKERWKRDVFTTFFEGAMQSKGAFKVIEKNTGKIIGCTRFYDYREEVISVLIGYTFYARSCWGKGINPQVKRLMLNHAFRHVSKVFFHVGANNLRSRIAIERLGATKTTETEIAYHGEASRMNCIYLLERKDWLSREHLPEK
jgi:RimJ/RimL family protein N-acetyltransferase